MAARPARSRSGCARPPQGARLDPGRPRDLQRADPGRSASRRHAACVPRALPPRLSPSRRVPRRRVVSMRWTRVVCRRPSNVTAKRPPRLRCRAETGSPGSSVDRIRGRRARSSTRPASRGATNRTVRWWSATAALARRYRSSASPGIRAPGSAMHSPIGREACSPRWVACPRAVRRTFRTARRVVPGRLRRVVAGEEPADRAGRRSRLGRRAHRRDGAAPELDPRVFGTHLLPPRRPSGHAPPSSSALVPVPPSVALRGPGALAVVASDDRVNVSEKEGEESREGEGVSGRAPLVRPAPCQGADERLAACRQRRPACRGKFNPLSSVRVSVLRGISRRDRPRSAVRA